MDLRVKDVAELLNVSEATVNQWVAKSSIPHYRLSKEFRFSRSEIEHWVLRSSSLPQPEKEHLGTQHFGLYRALHKGDLYDDLVVEDKEELIRTVVQRIAKKLRLDAEVVSELLLDRERLMPTALSHGIAVPHTRDFLLQESFDAVVMVSLRKPIEFGALDGQPVHTLFFLFACDDRRHLHLLAKIAHLCSNPAHLAFLTSRPPRDVLLDHIRKWEASIRQGEKRVCAAC